MVKEKTVTITVRVQPNARRNEIVRFVDSTGSPRVGSMDSPQAEGIWHIKITAPAVDGKANEALVRFLSEVLGVSKTSLSVRLGVKGRQKVVKVAGLTQDRVTERLKNELEIDEWKPSDQKA